MVFLQSLRKFLAQPLKRHQQAPAAPGDYA
jgi:hypothetical protein